MIKNAREIKLLACAARITKEIWDVVSKDIKPGKTEKEIKRGLEAQISKRELKRSFKTIVASGPNGSKPHAAPTERKIKAGDFVVVDFGVIYKGYHSDMTRTAQTGKAKTKMKNLYKVVEEAHSLAIRSIKPGIKISDLVKKTHNYIRKEKLGQYILHSLGHGVGKKIHEAPKLSEKNNGRLQKNMVITIEPGLYVRGRGGVRIEDMVLVGTSGAKVLTQ